MIADNDTGVQIVHGYLLLIRRGVVLIISYLELVSAMRVLHLPLFSSCSQLLDILNVSRVLNV